jgi:CHAT domain-containing protein
MAQEPNNQEAIRKYLLGELDEPQRQAFEERLISDETVLEELEIVEDELIDAYLNDELKMEDKVQFVSFFLSSPERRDQLRFGRAFRGYVASHPSASRIHESKPAFWSQLLRSPARIIVYALVIAAVAVGGWLAFFRESDVDKGLLALNEAYRQQRPIEARISQFDYAPFSVTRGAGSERVDSLARDRAERILLDAVNSEPGDESYHALGNMYLAKREFDKAIEQFNESLLRKQTAQTYADFGAALLEKGRIEQTGVDPGKGLENLALALDKLNRALMLDEDLLEALFNRALCYQHMMLFRQAAEDWRRFLEKEPNSKWAGEAKRNLELIESQQKRSKSSAEVLEDFLAAYRRRDDEQAWRVISQNRESITSRMVNRQLSTVFLKLSHEGNSEQAKDILHAFHYGADLEKTNANDPYFSEIATYYSALTPVQTANLSRAQSLLRQGFDLCLQGKLGEALPHFESAKHLFEENGDTWEGCFADYWIAYCCYHTDRLVQGAAILAKMSEFCEAHGYKWLFAQSLSLSANIFGALNEYSKSLTYNKRSLEVFEAISDGYNIQKLNSQMANGYRYLSGFRQALRHLQNSLSFHDSEYVTSRQRWRDYEITAQTFYALGLYDGSAAFAHEALNLAEAQLKDPAIIYITYLHLGLIYGKLRRYPEAIEFARNGLRIAESINKTGSSMSMVANSMIQVANIERQAGNCQQALQGYEQAMSLYDRLTAKDQTFEAYKGRLLCQMEMKNYPQVQESLASVFDLFEKYRSKILEQQNRDSFFKSQQSIYDTGIYYELKLAQNSDEAFNYSELSRARSLLDAISNGKQTLSADEPNATLPTVSKPLKVSTIRQRMPASVQVIQYAVLEDRLVIWLVSQNQFETVEHEISSEELTTKARRFNELVSVNPIRSQDELRRLSAELYQILILPVAAFLDHEKEICIVPDKVLNYVPFAALTSPSGKYLVNEQRLSFAPSANVFLLSSQSAQRKATALSERLLAVGNPTFDHEQHPLPDLPSAEVEAKSISEFYNNAETLIGIKSLKAIVFSEMRKADVVHFAGHYIVDEGSPLLSKLVLARNIDSKLDGDLSSLEVLRTQPLKARLILLSACSTGMQDSSGEGMVGMARAFIASGVPTVVASQWAVDSDATAKLMISFHRHMKLEGNSVSNALRLAQLDILNDSGGRLREPYYWAAFQTIGGYSGS